MPPEALEEPQLPALPSTPKCYSQAEYGLYFWKAKLSERLSSPSQQPFDSWAHGTGAMLAYGDLVKTTIRPTLYKGVKSTKGKITEPSCFTKTWCSYRCICKDPES